MYLSLILLPLQIKTNSNQSQLKMKITNIQLLLILTITVSQATAQQSYEWKGKKCAVVLTYDDALNVHLDNVIPSLDSAGFKGTFYVMGESEVLSKRMSDWKTAANHGHELGNHTLTHPCVGQMPGREWVSQEKDLSRYTFARVVNEINITNTLLHAIDGKTERSFAYPCGDLKVDTIHFYQHFEHVFAGARGVQEGMKHVKEIDLTNINCYFINGHSGEYLVNLVKKAMVSQTLLVFLFHGVGGEHSLNVSLPAHRQLITFLKQHQKDIWVAPMVDVANYIHHKQIAAKQ
jgi:peptidoglycan-N-acetylglucosamine deacetylase